jgi:hypothetical protein
MLIFSKKQYTFIFVLFPHLKNLPVRINIYGWNNKYIIISKKFFSPITFFILSQSVKEYPSNIEAHLK